MGLLFLALFTPSLSRAEGVDGYSARVARASSRLEPVTGLRPEIIIKEDDAQSAFVLPNGTVVISSGLLASAGSDDEVAFVIAHEISHIIARDQMGPAAKLTGLSDPTSLQLVEIRADASAVSFMKKAGYSPEASVSILNRLSLRGANLSSRITAISRLLGL